MSISNFFTLLNPLALKNIIHLHRMEKKIKDKT